MTDDGWLISLDCLWTVFGLSLDCLWTVSGLSLDCLWTVSGLSLDRTEQNRTEQNRTEQNRTEHSIEKREPTSGISPVIAVTFSILQRFAQDFSKQIKSAAHFTAHTKQLLDSVTPNFAEIRLDTCACESSLESKSAAPITWNDVQTACSPSRPAGWAKP